MCLVQKFGENRERICNVEKIELKASRSRFCILKLYFILKTHWCKQVNKQTNHKNQE